MLKTKIKSKRIPIIIIWTSAILILGGAVFAYSHLSPKNTIAPSYPASDSKSAISGQNSPSNADQKQQNIQTPNITKNTKLMTGTIIITSIGYDSSKQIVEVRAYISDLIEDSGQCTATFTKVGQNPVVTKSTAFSDATTTQCGKIDTPITRFATKGVWNVSVSYLSNSTTAQASGSIDL